MTPSNGNFDKARLNVCPNVPITIGATGQGTLSWFTTATGGTAIATGNPYVTPPLTANVVYFVQSTFNGCNSDRSPATVTVTSVPTSPIQYSGSTITANNLFNNYSLKKDGVVVQSGSNGGSFSYNVTQCGNYQASFFNTSNQCQNISAVVTRQFSPCGTFFNLSNVATPGLYSYDLGVEPGAPTTAFNGSQITIPFCQNGLVNVRIRSAVGCEYLFSVFTNSLNNGAITVSSTSYSDSISACELFSNVVSVATPAPTNTTNPAFLSICNNVSTSLTVSGTGTINWFTTATGGNSIGTGLTFNTPLLSSNTTYYVQQTINGCISVRTPISVSVLALIPNPVSTTPTANLLICVGLTTFLSVNAAPFDHVPFWTLSPQGGNTISTNSSLTTGALTANTTYYVGYVNVNNNCNSVLTPISVQITAPPVAPTNTTATAALNVCSGSGTTLTTTSVGVVSWFSTPTGGTALQTGLTFTTPNLTANTTYYAQSAANGCNSGRTAITVTVTLATAPTNKTSSANLSICSGTTAVLTVGGSGIINWYASLTSTTSIHTGSSFTTPILTANTTYYAEQVIGNCISLRTAITIVVSVSSAYPVSSPLTNYYWPIQSPNFTQSLINANTLVPTSGIITSTDRFGNANSAYEITANSQFINFPNALSTPITVSFWYYYGALNSNFSTLLSNQTTAPPVLLIYASPHLSDRNQCELRYDFTLAYLLRKNWK